MLQNSFYAISGTFYTLLNNTDLYLSYFTLSYVFLGHNDSVEWGLTVLRSILIVFSRYFWCILDFWESLDLKQKFVKKNAWKRNRNSAYVRRFFMDVHLKSLVSAQSSFHWWLDIWGCSQRLPWCPQRSGQPQNAKIRTKIDRVYLKNWLLLNIFIIICFGLQQAAVE